MKNIIFLLALTLGGWSVPALSQAPTVTDAELFKNNFNLARNYEKSNQGLALTYYKKALEKAATDDEKAQAQLGIGRNTPLRKKGEADPQGNNAARRAALQAVLDLPGASTAQKHEARLELGLLQLNLEEDDGGIAHFQSVADSAEAAVEIKLRAQLYAGEALVNQKRYAEALSRLTFVTADAKASPLQNTVARRLMARSHLQQGNTRLAAAEMKKRAAPNLNDGALAQIYLENGDFFRQEKQPALARAAYEMIAPLQNASAEMNVRAVLQIGATYFEEANYRKAQAIWELVPAMRGANAEHTGSSFHSVAVAYADDKNPEKNLEKARDYLAKWRDSSTNIATKVQAWEQIAGLFLVEKNYVAAREALTNVGKLGNTLFNVNDKSQLNLRQKLGTAQVYEAEGNFVPLAATLKEILDAVPVADGNPSFYYEARQRVEAYAEKLAKEPASRQAAFSLYEAIEKHYPYEFNKGKANMAMGDILAAQGKKDEAKAKYQRVIELRKNYDDAKEAQKKINALN